MKITFLEGECLILIIHSRFIMITKYKYQTAKLFYEFALTIMEFVMECVTS